MQFEHPVVPEKSAPTDEQGELQLSESLHALSGRLAEEARELAERFPPTGANNAAVHETRPARREADSKTGWRRLPIGVLLPVLAALAAGWTAARLLHDAPPPAPEPQSAEIAVASATAAAPAADRRFSRAAERAQRSEPIGSAAYEVQTSSREIREVLADAIDPLADDASQAEPVGSEEKIALLQEALERYRSAIVYLQKRLSEREQEQIHNRQIIESLQSEVDSLRGQVQKAGKRDSQGEP